MDTPAPTIPLREMMDGPGHSPVEVCRFCRFWHVVEAQDSETPMGVVAPCRRDPPRLQLLMVPRQDPKALFAGKPQQMEMQVQPFPVPSPSTPADFWCGEFKRQERFP